MLLSKHAPLPAQFTLVHTRSSCFSRHFLNTREKNLLEDKWKSREETLKKREDNVRRAELEFEQKLADQVTKYCSFMSLCHFSFPFL